MTDSGAAVLLYFSQPVDIRTPVAEEFFNCTMLFSDAEEGVINASCIGLPGSVLCGANEAGLPVSIVAPANPLQPILQVNYAATGTACEAVYLVDASGSLNSGGRPWSVVEWVLLPLSDGDQALLDASNGSAAYLNDTLSSGTETLVLNTTLLIPEVTYRLNLTLGNFLGANAVEGPIEFVIEDSSTAVVQMSGSSKQLAVPDKFVSVATTVIEPCDGSDVSNGTAVNFTGWFAEDASGSQFAIEVERSTEQQLVVAPYTFAPGETYTLYWSGETPDPVTVGKSIEVVELPLSPSLQGCSRTVVPVMQDGSSELHVIDATASSDPNVGPQDSTAARNAVDVVFSGKAYPNDGLASFTEDASLNATADCNITAASL
eukprot:scaffold3167_cov314-Pinguiococcus_pyrenoidosus.AAC.1